MIDETLVPLLDAEAVADAAAEIFVASANAAAERHGGFTVCLAGGSTPRRLYELLATPEFAGRVPWDNVDVVFGDERCVPTDHEDSNFRMASDRLLNRVPIPRNQIHPMMGYFSNPSRAAYFYEEELRKLYPDAAWPRFDLLLLGLGEDGHTASLFPGTDALKESERWCVANFIPDFGNWRITLTLPALCHAELILFLVTGKSKARIVAEAFGGKRHEGEPYPAERVVPVEGRREVLLDRAAARGLYGSG